MVLIHLLTNIAHIFYMYIYFCQKQYVRQYIHMLTITLLLITIVENCGKIIEKINTVNLVVSGRIRLIQLTENPKKVSCFFIMIFQR